MKIKLLLTLSLAFTVNFSFSQNKKEQIETLSMRSDSLNKVILSKEAEINYFTSEIEQKNQSLFNKDNQIKDLEKKLDNLLSEKNQIEKSLDSTKKLIRIINERTSPFSSKKQILKRLVGEYSLDNISGFMGANTLFDTYFDNGKWTSNSSSLELGMRELYQNDLTQTDEKLLESIKLVIDSNLTINFKIGSKLIFTSPFSEMKTDYNVSNIENDELHDELQNLNSSVIFQDDYLVLFVKNDIELDWILKGNFDIVTGDVLTLKYNLFTSTFELCIFNNSCCENSTLSFRRKNLY
jgi:hypothetical protein